MNLTPMRVAVVTTSYPLGAGAMAGTFVAQMLRRLPPDVAPTVVTPCGSTPLDRAAVEPPPIRCFRYAPWRWQTLAQGPGGLPGALRRPAQAPVLLGLFLPALALACLRAARTADIVHAHWAPTAVLAALAGRATGTPTVATLRGSDVALAETSALFRGLLRLCLRLCRRTVAVGEGLRERIATLTGADPASVAVIPNGIAPAFFAVPALCDDPRADSLLRVAAVGALVPVKGLDTLLDAAAALAGDLPLALTLAGEGPERAAIEARLSDPRLAGRVELLGAIPTSRVPDLLAHHPLFVLASRAEGRPNALVEAMAAGRAVVASDIPGVRDVVVHGQSGLLFPPGDAAALAERLRALAREPGLAARLGRAARTAVAHLTWEESARRHAALYRELLAERARPCAD